MRLTGLSEFLWFLLIFGALFAFTVWRQQRDRRRREERMARLSAPVAEQSGTVPVPVPVAQSPEAAPDISWGRRAEPAPPPEVPPGWTEPPPEIQRGWTELPAQAEALAMPAPSPARAPRRTAWAAPGVAARRDAVHLRSVAGLRHAVVALTVLGPCRAMEPYGAQWPQQVPDGGSRPSGPRSEGA